MNSNFFNLTNHLNLDIYSYDYTGYGFSSGKPSEKNMYDDILTIYNYIIQKQPIAKVLLLNF